MTLGTGSFATVKLGTALTDDGVEGGGKGSTWAVKIINKKNLDKEDEDALEAEITIMQTVKHQNIIKLREVFHTPKHVYMVMEVCNGGELFDRIVEKEHYSEADAAKVICKVAHALHYCHTRDDPIVHRDLKPENLLLTSSEDDADVKIADFGLAKILNSETMMQTACGTPGYVAPEILEVQPYDKQVDAWSLGVITYILLCGFPPFYDENNAALFASIKEGKFDFPSPYWDNISEEAKDFIQCLLKVDPAERMPCGQVLGDGVTDDGTTKVFGNMNKDGYTSPDSPSRSVASHPWITTETVGLGKLSVNGELLKFNARRKFKMATANVLTGVKLKNLMSGMGK